LLLVKRSRLAALVGALVTTVGVLAACSPSHAGAAAVVGDERISTSDLRTMVDRGLAGVPASATTKPAAIDIERLDLTQLIMRSVLKQMAKNVKATPVTDAQIDAELTAAADGSTKEQLEQGAAAQGVDPQSLRLFAEVVAYEKAVIQALPIEQSKVQAAYDAAKASKYEQVHVAHILVATKAQADSILAQVQADPSKFGALATQFSTDTGSKANGGDLGFAAHGSYVQEFGDAAWAGKDGTIVGPVQTQFGFHIIKIIEHRTTSLADATSELKLQLNGGAFVAAFKKASGALNISVNPRFGKWVPDAGSDGLGAVQASDTDALSTPVSPSPSPSPSQDRGSSSTDSGGGSTGGSTQVAPTTGTSATATAGS
jgi:parvulin-like peptidyl-prolyl isomerase